MAGASFELKESYLVNPYNTPGVVEAIHTALNQDAGTKQQRMAQLRQRIESADIDKWLQDYLISFKDAIEHRYPTI